MITSSSEGFFEQKYEASEDPWNFATSPYEDQRYASIMKALNGSRFRFAVEPGCSIGVLSSQLATICDRVEAFDFSQTAVDRARRRCAALPNVRVRKMSLQDVEALQGDLLVFSEIGYYFESDELGFIWQRLVRGLKPGAIVVACHWLGHSTDHVLSGDAVHETLAMGEGLHHLTGERYPEYRLDVWSKAGVIL